MHISPTNAVDVVALLKKLRLISQLSSNTLHSYK